MLYQQKTYLTKKPFSSCIVWNKLFRNTRESGSLVSLCKVPLCFSIVLNSYTFNVKGAFFVKDMLYHAHKGFWLLDKGSALSQLFLYITLRNIHLKQVFHANMLMPAIRTKICPPFLVYLNIHILHPFPLWPAILIMFSK